MRLDSPAGEDCRVEASTFMIEKNGNFTSPKVEYIITNTDLQLKVMDSL